MQSQEELRSNLLAFEDLLLRSLRAGSDGAAQAHVQAAAEQVHRTILESEHLGTLEPATRDLGARIGQRLGHLVHLVRTEQRERAAMLATARNEVRQLLQQTFASTNDTHQERSDASLNAKYMRAWFLRNLGHPFPSREAKMQILDETNAETKEQSEHLVYNQAVLWFINTRRRSGWTNFLRSYANNDKGVLLEIAWALQYERGGTHESREWSAGPSIIDGGYGAINLSSDHSEEYTLRDVFPQATDRFLHDLRKSWETIVERIKVGAKDRVGEWVNEVMRLSQTMHTTSGSDT